jgi:PAS domain S-box-containing protein
MSQLRTAEASASPLTRASDGELADALRRAAEAIGETDQGNVYQTLVQFLAAILRVDAAFIAVFTDATRTQMRTLAAILDGRPLRGFEYALAGSPCAAVVGRAFRFVPAGVREEFPPGTMFRAKGMDAYAAYPMTDPAGVPLGLIAAMSRAPMRSPDLAEPVLRIFAGRAVAEIERGRAEEALRTSEASYRAIFEASEDPIFVHDCDTGAILDVSPKASELYGYTREELLHIRIGDVSANEPPYTGTDAARLIQRAKARSTPLRFEWRARHKDGRLMWHEVTLKRVVIAGVPRVLAFVRDVTARKDADEALRASEEQYRAIFNASAETLVLRDERFRIVDVNPTYEATSGYAREEVLGSDRVIANPPETEALFRSIHRRALEGERVQLETRIVRRDGTDLEIELRAVQVVYRGRPHVLYAGRDVSARKRAEAARVALEAQLRQAQKMEAIGQLTGGIAHDFNNILTSAMGYIGLAAERPSVASDAKLDNYLEQARKACRRARDLIQQMLTFSRGGSAPACPVHLPPLLAESANLLRSSLPGTVMLELESVPDPPPIMADPVQIEQILFNLCLNARDAMGGAGVLRVRVGRATGVTHVCASCRQRFEGDYVELAVHDQGQGIPAAILDRIFEPFFTTKEIGRGSGMGLAMVHGIVHRHGGHVVVDSRVGSGSVFRVLFPALHGQDAVKAAALGAEAVRGRDRVRLTGRVLVVDDEDSVGALLREVLEGCGLHVHVATHGRAALDIIDQAREPYDLVITDLSMPGMTGLALARELARRKLRSPVLLLTGYGEGLTELELREAGVVTLIAKPVEPQTLIAVVSEWLAPATASG